MKIAAFYDNIREGVAHRGLDMRETLGCLKNDGLDNLFMSDVSFQEDRDTLVPIMGELSIGLEGLFHFCNFSQDPKERDYETTIHLAKEFGAGHVLLIPGMCSDDMDKEIQIQNMLCGMRKAAAYGKQMGIRVALENFDGLSAPYCSVEGLRRFMDEVPDLACCFDTGNFIMYHENELEAFPLFEDRLCALHLKDRSDVPLHLNDREKVCADGVRKYPAPVGYGNIHIAEILQHLRDIGYTGNVIAELYDCDPEYMVGDITKSIRWIRSCISRI